MGSRSAVFLPLRVDGRVTGAVGFTMLSAEREWTPDVRRRLDVGAALFTQALARQQRDEALRAAALEVETLKRQLQGPATPGATAGTAGPAWSARASPCGACSIRSSRSRPRTRRCCCSARPAPARNSSPRRFTSSARGRRTRWCKVNCAAIPPTLIESELFGREKGAFTGALARQVGRFEMADHSTIFLDEIGDLPAEVQVKLLRVLEERTIERLGSPRPILVDVRIIAATHRNLEQRVAEGSVPRGPLLPPERVSDRTCRRCASAWRTFRCSSGNSSRSFRARSASGSMRSTGTSCTALQQYPWPGNVRELRNVVERAMIVSTSRRLGIPSPQRRRRRRQRSPKLADVEKDHIRGVLESTGWRIRGTGGAADRLGLKPTTLETRMAKLGPAPARAC